jgi:hypothetical protein
MTKQLVNITSALAERVQHLEEQCQELQTRDDERQASFSEQPCTADVQRGRAGGFARARYALRHIDGTFMSDDERIAALEEFSLGEYERYAAGGRARASTALRAHDGRFLPNRWTRKHRPAGRAPRETFVKWWTVIFGSGGVVAAVIAAIQLLMSRSEKRSTAAVLINVNASVTFWKTWLEANAAASTELTDAKQRAIERLANLSQAMDELADVSSPQPHMGWIPFLSCFYRPAQHSVAVWFFRVMFYWLLATFATGFVALGASIKDAISEISAAEEALHLGPAALLGPAAFDPAVFYLPVFSDILGVVGISILCLGLLRLIVFATEYEAAKAKPISRPPIAVENLLSFLRDGRKMKLPPVAVENFVLFLQSPHKIKRALAFIANEYMRPKQLPRKAFAPKEHESPSEIDCLWGETADWSNSVNLGAPSFGLASFIPHLRRPDVIFANHKKRKPLLSSN